MMRWLLVLLVACQKAPAHAPPAPTEGSDSRVAARPPPADASTLIPWQWDTAPDLFPRLDLTAGKHVLALDKNKLVLRGPSWSVEVAPGRDTLTGAGLAADDARVYVAFYNRIAAGCQLAAFDAATGKQLWANHLEGIGPIGHSKYSNRVQMRLVGGHPTVFGSEAKRYIEQRDAATGALVSHQLFPPDHQPVPISEALYYELDLRLGDHATHTLKVDDFLTRHVLMSDADHAARGIAFSEAVRQLDHLLIVGGKYRLEVKLVDKSVDFDVIAKRLPLGS